jgi:hypothetical protein
MVPRHLGVPYQLPTYIHIYIIHIHTYTHIYTYIRTYTHMYTYAHIGLKRIDMIVISIKTWVG